MINSYFKMRGVFINMKNLLKNIWEAPGASIAGALNAALAVVIASDLGIPIWALVSMSASAAFLGFLSGPNKVD